MSNQQLALGAPKTYSERFLDLYKNWMFYRSNKSEQNNGEYIYWAIRTFNTGGSIYYRIKQVKSSIFWKLDEIEVSTARKYRKNDTYGVDPLFFEDKLKW